jgi:DNA-binding transcriptional MerR regulator
MNNQIKISDFVKLTGSTLKTVIYYHKIGLLQEPERSLSGYRLYGSAELSRMQRIKYLKGLGLDLRRIKEILGDIEHRKTLQEVLLSLQAELIAEKINLEERISKIEKLLNEDPALPYDDSFTSPSFQMVMDVLGADQIEKYFQACPELFEQQRKVHSILDGFQWGDDYQETFRALADFFKDHPGKYQVSLDYGVRLTRLANLPEDDPEVEALALESFEFIKSMPQLINLLGEQAGMKKHTESLYNDLLSDVLSPAQVKHGQLLQKYLASQKDKSGGNSNGR